MCLCCRLCDSVLFLPTTVKEHLKFCIFFFQQNSSIDFTIVPDESDLRHTSRITHFRYDYFRLRLSLVSTCIRTNNSANAIVNVTAVELRFGAVVLTEKLVFDKTYEKIGVADSHFNTHGDAISLFVVVATE